MSWPAPWRRVEHCRQCKTRLSHVHVNTRGTQHASNDLAYADVRFVEANITALNQTLLAALDQLDGSDLRDSVSVLRITRNFTVCSLQLRLFLSESHPS